VKRSTPDHRSRRRDIVRTGYQMNKIRIRRKKDGRYCYDIWYHGKRHRKITNLNKGQTEDAAHIRLKELEKDYLGIQEARPPKPILFEDFADHFLETHSKLNKRSWRSDKYILMNLKAFFKNTYLSRIGPEMVERYKAQRINCVSPATVNREVALIKTMLNKAVIWGRLPVNPIAGKAVGKLKEKNIRERILSLDETGCLINAAVPRLRPILVIALNTGMRRNEILSLKWANVNKSERYIFIEDSKTGKSRKVPMNEQVIAAFKGLSKVDDQLIFFNPETKKSYKDIKTAFRSACDRAKIKGLRLHDLRHTFAWRYIEAGGDIVSLSKILGHSSIQMTMRYCNATPEHMQKIVDKVGKVFVESIEIGSKVDIQSKKDAPKTLPKHSYAYN
jgi:integrase